MFDLNIDVETNSNLVNGREKEVMTEEELPEGSRTNTELSGTSSSSSVVNAPADEFAGEFSETKPFVTQQFFPMSEDVKRAAMGGVGGGERELELLRLGSSQTAHNQWLNLSVSGSGVGSGSVLGAEQPPEQSGKQQQVRRSRRGPRSRSSQYRGVTFYRRTGRWESHIWDCGKQVYLGGFDTAHAAARAYDRAALKFRGVDADINFNIVDYEEDMKQMKNLNKEEFVHILRRQSNGFSRGSSRYRGVTLHKCGRWEARMGQFLGKKAYDKAAIQCNGREALTNFEPSSYQTQMPFQPNFEGGGHNLDLNLGISITIDGPNASGSMGMRESQTPHSSLQFANGKRPMVKLGKIGLNYKELTKKLEMANSN
ncbi:hypothetical protein Cgig2_014015 [Carnegiea gigantea]|uniref:AP2/ERF domain-containing protein n=1 Tax=Carnegiea gigantea TaxID=171969 RepID=A0A9Q1QQ89_9CARY|nr:hypothetical protein Cgig2_014015 [Carnegiea gigantea]